MVTDIPLLGRWDLAEDARVMSALEMGTAAFPWVLL